MKNDTVTNINSLRKEALDMYLENTDDIVIINILIPNMDGFQYSETY